MEERWDESIGKKRKFIPADVDMAGTICMPGMTSTSESFKVAMNFAKQPAGTDNPMNLQSVLFVICLHNYHGFYGLRLNSAMYSAHPEEREILLTEGAPMFVMGVEEMYIDNFESDDIFWADFNMKSINVIYLFHPSYGQ